jgi:chemotaxis protein MotB
MPVWARFVKLSAAAVLALALLPGCCCCMYDQMRACQCQSAYLCQQNQMLANSNWQATATSQQMERALAAANQRIDNLSAERAQLQQRYIALLDKQRGQPSPLSPEATERFKKLQEKYPQFEFDARTGVSKFSNDVLFSSGSSEIREDAKRLLNEFAKIMNDGDARRLNILVVGHTDDRPIAHEFTRNHHPSNWNLSTDRADSVVLELSRHGMPETRLGAAGYSMYQPVAQNATESTRRKNRRVEIFVLAPDAAVVGWDPNWSRH